MKLRAVALGLMLCFGLTGTVAAKTQVVPKSRTVKPRKGAKLKAQKVKPRKIKPVKSQTKTQTRRRTNG
jgi:hypothetical protein